MIVTSYLALAVTQLETSGEYVCNESPTINVLLCGYIRPTSSIMYYGFISIYRKHVYFL